MKPALELNWRTALRWLLAGVLLLAALSKLASLHGFYVALLTYKLPVPNFVLKSLTIVLPWLELLCGLMLLSNVRVQPALLWTVILFGAFALATGQAWARGLNIACGCFKLNLFGSDWGALFESAGFACLRAVLLCVGAIVLFRKCSVRPPAT